MHLERVLLRALLATILLGLIWSIAPPASAEQPAPPVLTISAPTTAAFGTDVALSGRAIGIDGIPLTGTMVKVTGGVVPVEVVVDALGGWAAIVAPARAGTAEWSATTAEPALSARATTVIVAATTRLSLTAPPTSPAGAPVTLAGIVTYPTMHGSPTQAPVPGAEVMIERAVDGAWVRAAGLRSGSDGRFSSALVLPTGTHTLRARMGATADLTAATSPAVTVKVLRIQSALTVAAPTSVRSEAATNVRATLVTKAGTRLAGRNVHVQARRTGIAAWSTLASGRTDATGTISTRFTPWKSMQIRAVSEATATEEAAVSAIITIRTTPSASPVSSPKGAPKPEIPFPQRRQAVGAGANARVSVLSDALWKRMVGVTWNRGCDPRSELRLVKVNYWGFDGYRYAGELVTPRRDAAKVAGAFSDMYRSRYPIRQMVLPETFGRNPAGPGANDYAQMAADNTSAFNCRYVVGREDGRVMSPHANRGAVDINPWENPYVTKARTYPNRWYVIHRPSRHPAVLHRKDAATKALTRRGWSWGGRWSSKDYQHFQRA